jgi:(2R)-ethylmalonyl-CoA mutase
VQDLGGAVAAVESGYLKGALVASHAERRRRVESGEDVVVGVNRFTTTAAEPAHRRPGRRDPDRRPPRRAAGGRRGPRLARRPGRREAEGALDALRAAARTDENLMAATLVCARAGVTTGEWSGALREVFGEYRAPTGVSAGGSPPGTGGSEELAEVRAAVRRTGEELGRRLRLLVGKPGLDGHSNGAEQIAVRARDCGFEVVYQGIRLTSAQIVAAAVQEDVHVVGLSILSGSHLQAVPAVLDGLRDAGAGDVRWWSAASSRTPNRPAAARDGSRGGLHAQGLLLTAVLGTVGRGGP